MARNRYFRRTNGRDGRYLINQGPHSLLSTQDARTHAAQYEKKVLRGEPNSQVYSLMSDFYTYLALGKELILNLDIEYPFQKASALFTKTQRKHPNDRCEAVPGYLEALNNLQESIANIIQSHQPPSGN